MGELFNPEALKNDETKETPQNSAIEIDNQEIKDIENDLLSNPEFKKDSGESTDLEKQIAEIEGVERIGIEELTDNEKGNYGEMKTDIAMAEEGWDRISKDVVTSIEDTGHQGIDGVYERINPYDGEKEYCIVESKYSESETPQLRENTDGTTQMDKDWIYDSKRLEDAVGKEKAEEIRESHKSDPDSVHSMLAHTDINGEVKFYDLDENANIIKDDASER